MPPIVGVPAFAWCPSGPSSRISWPNSRWRASEMNLGPRNMQMSSEPRPAIRIDPRPVGIAPAPARAPPPPRQRPPGPGRARPLDQNAVALVGNLLEELAGLLGRAGRLDRASEA